MDKIADIFIEIFLAVIGHKFFKKKWVRASLLILLIFLTFVFWLYKENQLLPVTSQIITLNNPVRIEDPKPIFKNSEKPKFTLLIPQATTSEIGETKQGDWKSEEETIHAVAVHKATNRTVPVNIKKVEAGKFEVEVENKSNHFPPGAYTLKVSSKESFIYTRNLNQDFSWGVLAVNLNKSVYKEKEEAKLSFGVVDDEGHTICDAALSLKIKDPFGISW